jgi:hypothetical protein
MKCFVAGRPYEHGGISPQEVVVPDITIRSAQAKPEVSFGEIKWRGLRCRMRLAGAYQGLSVDLRTKPADPGSSVADAPKPVAADGSISLIIPDDSLDGSAAVLVIYSPDAPQKVLAQRPTVIGGSSDDNM